MSEKKNEPEKDTAPALSIEAKGMPRQNAPSPREHSEETSEPKFLRLAGIAAYRNTSIEEAVARVRALRDEWD